MNPAASEKRVWAHCLTVLAVLCASLIGCAAAPGPARSSVEIAAAEYGRMYQGALEVLRDRHLQVAEADYRFGHITSVPLVSPTIAEPWRRSLGTTGQTLQSTLNSQRRVVSITIEPLGDADGDQAQPTAEPETPAAEGAAAIRAEYRLIVEVTLEQLQVPRRYLTGSTSGGKVFGTLEEVPTEWAQRGITGSYWSPVGRDPHLEQQLLEQIVRRSMTVDAPLPDDAQLADDLDTTEAPPTQELTDE